MCTLMCIHTCMRMLLHMYKRELFRLETSMTMHVLTCASMFKIKHMTMSLVEHISCMQKNFFASLLTVHTHIPTCTCAYICTYTHTLTYTHTQTHAKFLLFCESDNRARGADSLLFAFLVFFLWIHTRTHTHTHTHTHRDFHKHSYRMSYVVWKRKKSRTLTVSADSYHFSTAFHSDEYENMLLLATCCCYVFLVFFGNSLPFVVSAYGFCDYGTHQ